MFEGAVCIGICTPSPVEGKRIFLNPPGDTIINGGDQLIFIAEDNDTYWPADTLFLTSPGACPDVQEPPKQPVKTLCIGWRRDMHEIMARGRMRCEVTIGFYQNGELVLNPEDKSAKINWQADDRIVVISED